MKAFDSTDLIEDFKKLSQLQRYFLAFVFGQVVTVITMMVSYFFFCE